MAQKIQTLLIDDIDGSEAEGTVRFGLDRASYEIDLSAAHAAELRGALARFITAGRKVPEAGSRRAGLAGRAAVSSGADSTEVREWARSQQIEVKGPRPGARRNRREVPRGNPGSRALHAYRRLPGPLGEAPGIWSARGERRTLHTQLNPRPYSASHDRPGTVTHCGDISLAARHARAQIPAVRRELPRAGRTLW